MKICFILFSILLISCAPNRESQKYYPKNPPITPDINPINPAIYQYYNILFVGKENQRSTGFRVIGEQEISLPDSFTTSNPSTYTLYLYSTNFFCEYNLVNNIYVKKHSCIGTYLVSNQTIYLNNLKTNEEANLEIGVYIDE